MDDARQMQAKDCPVDPGAVKQDQRTRGRPSSGSEHGANTGYGLRMHSQKPRQVAPNA